MSYLRPISKCQLCENQNFSITSCVLSISRKGSKQLCDHVASLQMWNDFLDFDSDSWSHCGKGHIQNDEIRKYFVTQKRKIVYKIKD